MNCTECQDLFCKHRSQSTAGGQCFYESKEQMEKLLAITTEATFAYVDWATFRREAAKDFMSAIITREAPQYNFACRNVADRVTEAIMWADELIKQLKEEKA